MQIFVKPLPMPDGTERRVFIPNTRSALPQEGASVEYSSYWLRRANEGAVSIGAEAKPEPKKKKSED